MILLASLLSRVLEARRISHTASKETARTITSPRNFRASPRGTLPFLGGLLLVWELAVRISWLHSGNVFEAHAAAIKLDVIILPRLKLYTILHRLRTAERGSAATFLLTSARSRNKLFLILRKSVLSPVRYLPIYRGFGLEPEDSPFLIASAMTSICSSGIIFALSALTNSP